MKTVTINLFNFNELNEKAKEKALNKLRDINLEDNWWQFTYEDAKNIGFDDSFIYDEIELKPEKRRLITTQLLSTEAIEAFRLWANTENKIEY